MSALCSDHILGVLLNPREWLPCALFNSYWTQDLGAVHILRQPPEGGEGVRQMLTIADGGGRGGVVTLVFGWRNMWTAPCICLTFSTVCFQVSPQIACIKRCKVTLVRCIFKLVAFVLLCDIVRPFHRGFHICIFYTPFYSIFRSLLHCCFAVCKNFRLKRVQNLKKKPWIRETKAESDLGESLAWKFWKSKL